MPLLLVLATGCFVGALSIRIMDPLIPSIARAFTVDPGTIALIATAYSFPYALGQPFLGSLGDALGKARIIKICLAILGLSLVVSAFAPNAEVLFASRIVAGLAGGGIIPLSLAMVGDRFAYAGRQVALSQLLSAMLLAQLVGVVGSGLLAEAIGWRWVLGISGLLTLLALVATLVSLRRRPDAVRQPFSLSGMRTGYAKVLENPRAVVCYCAVFVEGIVIFGPQPFVAAQLEARGAGGALEAGLMLAGMGIGGLIYTGLVHQLFRWLGTMFNLMRSGAVIAGIGLACLGLAGPWTAGMAAFILIGFGFYMMHSSLQTQATELSTQHRGASVALHAFAFFLGHAAGPVIFGIMFKLVGTTATMAAAGAAMAIAGFLTASALQSRDAR